MEIEQVVAEVRQRTGQEPIVVGMRNGRWPPPFPFTIAAANQWSKTGIYSSAKLPVIFHINKCRRALLITTRRIATAVLETKASVCR